MSFFVSRAVTPGGQDRADIFARGETAVLVVACGEDADAVLSQVREAVLDDGFGLFEPACWLRLLAERGGESSAVIATLGSDRIVSCWVGDGQAWVVGSDSFAVLTDGASPSGSIVRPAFDGRLILGPRTLATNRDAIVTHLRNAPWSGLADSVLKLGTMSAVLVAER